jgi:hypothetical protein
MHGVVVLFEAAICVGRGQAGEKSLYAESVCFPFDGGCDQ